MNSRDEEKTHAVRFFEAVIRWRWLSLTLAVLVLAGLGSQLGKLEKNTQADAFIDDQEPALVYRDRVEQLFDLKDPLVIAVQNTGNDGIYDRQSLELVRWLTQQLQQVPNIDPDGITSLATESHIEGDAAGMAVRDFLDGPLTPEHIHWIRRAIDAFPLYQGSLVAEDDSMTLVVAELLDQGRAEQTYRDVLALVEKAPATGENRIHVAGEGAVSGYLATYIDEDARRLNPLAGLIITLVLIVAFLTPRAALLPNLVVAGTVVATLGAMAASGVAFFVITNGLIVCMIGIAVADSIHIFSDYYEVLEARPGLSRNRAVALAMAHMWRPVTLTTLTTAAGFLALYPTNTMPPLQYFGLFGALAVVVAWILTLFVTPALLSFLRPRRSRPFRRLAEARGNPMLPRILGVLALGRPRLTLTLGVLIAALGAWGATLVQVNEVRIDNFQTDEPIHIADRAINAAMDGTYYLDVVIETPRRNGIYQPRVLRKIEKLQEFLKQQPPIHGTTSIADYIKQMNKAVNGDDPAYYRLPEDPNLVAQLFLLYTASGDPTDFDERIDSRRQTALVRANLKTGSYQVTRSMMPAIESYLARHFGPEQGASAHLSGRVNVDYHWIDGIAESHANSVLVSFAAVLLMASLLFRSVAGGLMAALPVGLSILVIYAVMGLQGIWLGVGTSMFAAIAIGLSVDFAIHTLDRLKEVFAMQSNRPLSERITQVYQSTGRALWFNLLAVGLGFGVLMTSQVPPLMNFGMLVALAVSAAFIASMLLLPAIALVFQPAFLFGRQQKLWKTLAALFVLGLAIAFAQAALAEEEGSAAAGEITARQVIHNMNSRDEGTAVQRDMVIYLTDRQGDTRIEKTRAFRRYFGDTKKTVIFYTEPANIAGTAFLTWDYADESREDDQWLYLPALRKVRRISASDRGDYFLGTDFTYEEIKKESKIAAEDYRFKLLGEDRVDGHHTWKVEAVPRDSAVRQALGYSRVVMDIDSQLWMPRRSQYWDQAGNFLKRIHTRQILRIDGIWTATDIEAINEKTGHRSRLEFLNIDYQAPVPPRLFERNALKRGY